MNPATGEVVSRVPFALKDEVDRAANECMNNGAYVSSWINYLVIAPPLIITKEEIEEGVNALDKSLTIADKEVA